MAETGPLGLSPGQGGGVFFLHGEDEFRKEELARALVDWHLDPGTRDFNYDPVRGTEVSVESLASVMATPPLMAEFRVVLVREVEALAVSPKAREELLKVTENPPPGLALVLLASIPNKSKAKFYTELKRKARSVEFRPISLDEMPAWLVTWAPDRHGVELTEDGARALVAGVGADLGVLDQEMGKLAGMVDEGEKITREVVEKGGTHVPAEDRWVWMDRVGNRQIEKALGGLDTLIGQGESGVSLVIGLATHLLRLGIARTGGTRALESALPPHQKWLSKNLFQQARGWSVEEIQDALLGLRRADRLLKSSSLADGWILEEWLLSLQVRLESASA